MAAHSAPAPRRTARAGVQPADIITGCPSSIKYAGAAARNFPCYAFTHGRRHPLQLRSLRRPNMSATKCDQSCALLTNEFLGCVNMSLLSTKGGCPPQKEGHGGVQPEEDLLIALCVLAGVYIVFALVSNVIVRGMNKGAKKREKIRLQTFSATAQFYKFDANKISLPNPKSDATRIYPDPQQYDQDEVGEPVAMSGVPLYNKNVVRGHEPPQPAAQQLGGGRLQRLWLARGGAGGGKMTGNAERRLRRLAALKVNDGAAEQPMLEGESANESRL